MFVQFFPLKKTKLYFRGNLRPLPEKQTKLENWHLWHSGAQIKQKTSFNHKMVGLYLPSLRTQTNTLLLHNAERERAQDRATEQGSGFWSIKEWVMMTYIGCGERVREKERGWGVGEIPSAYQSVYLALHAPSLWEGGKGKKESKRG